ncbi:CRISPR-associated endonuclease Cas1 [Peptoniphilus equinus]|uniref:CRISPR-associated endonuclease Cas1 n=1 Tax=Peptoniphilus equinus TaxID=3016343 RepID=A0ABY7QT04_9FIRM|nr:CRISPR-associated endonuclease Cas1 [Peptoniphilus equinus]WBW49923.1 CRISPR-associated endonuclease Cas1 [Peptoniphilus equinus]
MRKMLNTLYVTQEDAYLSLDSETLLLSIGGDVKARIPFDNIENIVCFSYIGCSPALMGKCVSQNIPINFISPYGKYWGKVTSGTQGNVFLRVRQIEVFKTHNLELSINTIVAKCHNAIQLIRRSQHDNEALRDDTEVQQAVAILMESIDGAFHAADGATLLGIEGYAAKTYFGIFNKLILNREFQFSFRTKRPPTDPVNAMLSFMYTIFTAEFAAGLETVGLDSYIGYMHALRSGRNSLACDLMEEARCIIERFVLTLINLKIVGMEDFEQFVTGAVYLNDKGRRKVLAKWQEKKRTTIKHDYLNETIPLGLLPYVQSNLLAKYVRGELTQYPNYLQKGN